MNEAGAFVRFVPEADMMNGPDPAALDGLFALTKARMCPGHMPH